MNGTLIWDKTHEEDFYPNDGIKTNDDKFLMIGSFATNVAANYFYRIKKMDQSGNTVWNIEGPKMNGKWYQPLSVLATSDSGFLISGVYDEDWDSNDQEGYSLVKLDANGTFVWEKRFPIGVPGLYVHAEKIIECNDGNYFIYGYSQTEGNNSITKSFYGKYDQSGNPIWTAFTPDHTLITGMEKGVDNGYILMMHYGADYSLQKVDDSGATVWTQLYPELSYGQKILKVGNAHVVLGKIQITPQKRAVTIMRLGSALATVEVAHQSMIVYPNPAKDHISLKLNHSAKISLVEIVDTSGRIIKTYKSFSDKLDISNLQKGVYIVKIVAGDKEYISRFIKR